MKRKHTSTKIHDKLKAIELVKNGERLADVAASYGVGKQTVLDWMNQEDRFKNYAAQCAENSLKMSIRSSYNPHMRKNAKGRQLHDVLFDGLHDGSGSSGWLKCKRDSDVEQMAIGEEATSSREMMLSTFYQQLQEVIERENIGCHQIYNADETRLNFRKLPNKTHAARIQRSAGGFNPSNERITILACANANGAHKIPLFLIGKSKHPRALKNVNPSGLPVKYEGQESACMTKTLFRRWFHEDFVPEVRRYLNEEGLPEKAILLLDNSQVHPDEDELVSDGIRVIFLPPDITSIIQPMEQNVLEMLKKKYRRIFLEFILGQIESDPNVMNAVKAVDILQTITWTAEAWSQVDSDTIARSWRGIFEMTINSDEPPNDEINADDVDMDHLIQLANGLPHIDPIIEEDISYWIQSDNYWESENATVDMERAVKSTKHIIPKQESHEPEKLQEQNVDEEISPEQALKALDVVLKYVRQQKESLPTIMTIHRLREEAAQSRGIVLK
ncbi:jerky protein homolog-like [Phlebotomus papatasi]|uniref:jerky protein homolog-like n=1 Tax=Phlebotomus papatasi TaxID=29031 RepID=UPI002483B6AC|nr:jerky protein homolog-like [Phlebotomus papatasi]